MDAGDYLRINQDALHAHPPAERIHILGKLATTAGAWIAEVRAAYIEQLRAEGGYDSDAALAEALGLSRAALHGVGDGPMVQGGIRPQLLHRTATAMLRYATGQAAEYLMQALSRLPEPGRTGRPGRDNLLIAARRITYAAKSWNPPHTLDEDDRRLISRGVAHAARVLTSRATPAADHDA